MIQMSQNMNTMTMSNFLLILLCVSALRVGLQISQGIALPALRLKAIGSLLFEIPVLYVLYSAYLVWR